jgi:cell division transport system permease protein
MAMTVRQWPWMEALATDFRIVGRMVQETWNGLRRTGWMNLLIVITMASILSIFGTILAFVLETQLFMDNIGSGLKISAYLDNDANIQQMAEKVQHMDNVKSVTLITREVAWEDMRKTYDVPELKNNPLPDTIHVQMADQRYIEPMVSQLKVLPGIEKVSYAQGVLYKLQRLAKATSFIGLAVSLFLGTLTLFIISNTIHLLIEARAREIEILRMMGVGNAYIRMPFLLQGGAYGLFGALVAYGPLIAAEFYIGELFHYFQFATSGYSLGLVFGVTLLLGVVVGSLGAFVSVRKYLSI